MKIKPLPLRIKDLLAGNPVAAMFIVDAILKQVEAVLKDEDATKKAMKTSFINGESWIEAAKACRTTIDL